MKIRIALPLEISYKQQMKIKLVPMAELKAISRRISIGQFLHIVGERIKVSNN